MVRSSLRFAVFFSALVLALGAEDCCGPAVLDPTLETECSDALDDDADGLVDCQDPDCRDSAACVATVQDCAPPDSDEDGDGLGDDADTACFENPVAALEFACTGQDTTTVAGDDSDETHETGGCDLATDSADGEGNSAHLEIATAKGGLLQIVANTETAVGASSQPSVDANIEITIDYAPGGNRIPLVLLATGSGIVGTASGECVSGGFTIPITAPGRFWLPAWPLGGVATCDVAIAIDAIGTGSGTFVAWAGVPIEGDSDGDGVLDALDRCPFSPNGVGVDDAGCYEHGLFGANGEYYCGSNSCSFNSSEQGFCAGVCTVTRDGVSYAVISPGGSITANIGGGVACDDCTAVGAAGAWRLDGSGATCFRDPSNAIACDDCPAAGCDLAIGDRHLGCTADLACNLIVDPDALTSEDPHAVTVEKATTDPGDDGIFRFAFEAHGRDYEGEITTADGSGEASLVFAFDGAATVAEVDAPGWDLSASTCSLTSGVATLDTSATCEFTNEKQPLGELSPIGVTFAETIVRVAPGFAAPDVPEGEYFAVAGENGIETHDASTLNLVPALTRLDDFIFTGMLGSIWFKWPDAPGGNGPAEASGYDALFGYKIGGGTRQTSWIPENHGFGFTGVANLGVLTATKEDGDPNASSGLMTASTGDVYRLFFDDFGGTTSSLSYAAYIHAFRIPSEFQGAAAFKTSGSAKALVAARSTTPETAGRLFLAEPTTPFGGAAVVGDLGIDPRLLECSSAVPGTWICAITCFGSDEVVIATWNGDATAAVVGTIPGGDAPLGLALHAAGAKVKLVATHFESDSVVLASLDGATGAIESASTLPAPAGCAEPSSALFRSDGAVLALCNNGSSGGTSAIWTIDATLVP